MMEQVYDNKTDRPRNFLREMKNMGHQTHLNWKNVRGMNFIVVNEHET